MTKGDRDKLRAEVAGGIAAAIVSTITNDEEYDRLYYLATRQGLKVSGWIARDSVKQADALMAELGIKSDD